MDEAGIQGNFRKHSLRKSSYLLRVVACILSYDPELDVLVLFPVEERRARPNRYPPFLKTKNGRIVHGYAALSPRSRPPCWENFLRTDASSILRRDSFIHWSFIPPANEVWSKLIFLSGYHADTPITIKAEASSKADSRIH